MTRPSVRIDFTAMPPSGALEAAARRRMRGIEGAYPAVQDWHACIQGPTRPGEEVRFGATVRVRVVGGRGLHGEGQGHDALAALRLAFNALELQLDADQASARARAAAWLAAVRSRMRGCPDFP